MFADLVDLVLPRHCYGCGRAGSALCAGCAPVSLVAVEYPGVAVVAAGAYDGALRDALLAYKERGRRDLVAPLAALLAAAVAVVDGAAEAALVPVPSTAAARRTRGGDHVRRLARRCGRCVPALWLTRIVQDSAGLDAGSRAANLAGALRARPPRITASRVVLVDDIVTSGATVREGVRALTAAGWQVTGAAVVAATPRRFPVAGTRVARRHGPV